jgi:anti-sigma regulatory factor (Ser/Thr protein kinase)
MFSQITLPATLGNLRQFLDFITTCAEKQGFCPKRVSQIELAAEEVLVNIFSYAYSEPGGEVSVTCGSDSARLLIRFEDSGIPFDPLSKEPPDVTADISERGIGGLGIFLAGKFMDEIHYRREKDRNILTLAAAPKAESEVSL